MTKPMPQTPNSFHITRTAADTITLTYHESATEREFTFPLTCREARTFSEAINGALNTTDYAIAIEQARRSRALLGTHMETLNSHPGVQRAVDRAIDAFDRCLEQEGVMNND